MTSTEESGPPSHSSNSKTSTQAATTADDHCWSNGGGGGGGFLPGRAAVGPLLLMATTPVFSIVFFHVCTHYHGNFAHFGRDLWQQQQGGPAAVVSHLRAIWPDPWDPLTWRMMGSFLGWELLLMRLVPGPKFTATVTPKGHRPVYKANGMACYVLTLLAVLLLDVTGLFDLTLVHDKFGNILSSMNVLALAFCVGLLVKGHCAPSTTDSGTTGSWITDFYWGMDLYPNIAGWDVKQFTNCRAGMMFWAVAVLSFCYKNMQLHQGRLQYGLAVSVALQLVYCSKFFYWEMGYMCR